MRRSFPSASARLYCAPLLVALLALAALLCRLDPGGNYPRAPQGPGLTLDEVFNVRQGVLLVAGAGEIVAGDLSIVELFSDRRDPAHSHPLAGLHNPDHPPLGRFWLGLFHDLTRSIAPPRGGDQLYVTACARVGSAVAFALLVFLVGAVSAKWYSSTAGFAASAALVLMPRMFGHAHLAALETLIGLACTATVLTVASQWSGEKRIGVLCAAVAGVLLGAALLTKVQAVLLPVPIALWAICHHRQRAMLPLAVWTLTAAAVFLLLWPWLWSDPLKHLQEYLGRTTGRVPLYTWYFGRRYADTQVPWHYAGVTFLTTVPVGLHLLGLFGVLAGPDPAWKQRREQVLLACLLFPLLVFSMPGVAVYDGARLFLFVFPLWAVFIGRGAINTFVMLRKKFSLRTAALMLSLLFAFQGVGIVQFSPVHLSYYNLLVGGLPGAARLGLERNYWGDATTRSLLDAVTSNVPEGARVDVVPVLHQYQLEEMLRQSPILRRHKVLLRPFVHTDAVHANYVLVFRREADLPEKVLDRLSRSTVLAEVERQGVQLAALYRLDESGREPQR